jgi:hypothetical protein
MDAQKHADVVVETDLRLIRKSGNKNDIFVDDETH